MVDMAVKRRWDFQFSRKCQFFLKFKISLGPFVQMKCAQNKLFFLWLLKRKKSQIVLKEQRGILFKMPNLKLSVKITIRSLKRGILRKFSIQRSDFRNFNKGFDFWEKLSKFQSNEPKLALFWDIQSQEISGTWYTV